jgi:hypothetical protein
MSIGARSASADSRPGPAMEICRWALSCSVHGESDRLYERSVGQPVLFRGRKNRLHHRSALTATTAPFTRPVFARLRRLCLALPQTSETVAWGHPNFRVGTKIFCTFEVVSERPSITFRVPATDIKRLTRQKYFSRHRTDVVCGSAAGWMSRSIGMKSRVWSNEVIDTPRSRNPAARVSELDTNRELTLPRRLHGAGPAEPDPIR